MFDLALVQPRARLPRVLLGLTLAAGLTLVAVSSAAGPGPRARAHAHASPPPPHPVRAGTNGTTLYALVTVAEAHSNPLANCSDPHYVLKVIAPRRGEPQTIEFSGECNAPMLSRTGTYVAEIEMVPNGVPIATRLFRSADDATLIPPLDTIAVATVEERAGARVLVGTGWPGVTGFEPAIAPGATVPAPAGAAVGTTYVVDANAERPRWLLLGAVR
jgi:hypothetical protein